MLQETYHRILIHKLFAKVVFFIHFLIVRKYVLAVERRGMFHRDGAYFREMGHGECFGNTRNISYGATLATLKSWQLVMILIILYGHLHHLYP